MQTLVMLSNHHVHLTEESVKTLFGEAGVTFSHYLAGESGPFATNEFVDVAGPKGTLSRFRVLGPTRPYDQVELLQADCYKLGVTAPVRNSGKLEGAAVLTIIGPRGQVTAPCGIIAHRHIHVDAKTMEENGWSYGQAVKVRSQGIRACVLENAILVKGGKGVLMHVDTEEGNAAGIKNNELLDIIAD